MSEQARTELSCGEDGGSAPWSPLRKGWQSSRLFNQDVGLPPFLEPREPRWMEVEWLQRMLAAGCWPGYVPSPMFVPYVCGSMPHPGQKISEEQYKWRVSLDVAHFASPEISLCVRDGFLEVAAGFYCVLASLPINDNLSSGKHEERQDEHGFIARCFTRKYRLPIDIDATKIVSSLSVDGILTVEAPVPGTSVPAAIIIPIKVEIDATEEKEEKMPDAEPDSSTVAESPEFLSAEDHEEESALETRDDQAQPTIPAAGPEQREERGEQEEESREAATGEPHPSVHADGDATESLQDSSKHHESPESQYSQDVPDTNMSQEPEHKEPAVGGEVQEALGSGEAGEETPQPEEPEPGTAPSDTLLSQEMQSLQQQHIE